MNLEWDTSRDAHCYNVPVLYSTVPYPTEKKEVEGVEISLLPMGPMNVPTFSNVAILPVATKDLSIAPRLAPSTCYRDST